MRKKSVDEKKEEKKDFLVGMGLLLGSLTMAAFGVYLFGKFVGREGLAQELIDIFENGGEWPVFETANKTMPGFIYELKAECLGD